MLMTLSLYLTNKNTQDSITKYMNNIQKLRIQKTEEENKTINYVDLHIHRNDNNIQLGIYRKPTQSDTTIHFTCNHPLQQKLPAYIFYINRLLSTPITDQARQQEWNTICTIAKNNGFPLQLIHNLKNKITRTQHTTNTPAQTAKKKWMAFTYHSPLIHKITTHSKIPIPIYISHSEQVTQFSNTFDTNPPTIH